LATKLIVGIGNPGKDYAWTRHNLGFLVVDYLAQEFRIKWSHCSFTKADSAHDKAKDFYLLKPLNFVNNSGIAVEAFQKKYNILTEDILVVCDDLNLDFKDMRVRPSGTSGGHNGLKSIKEKLESQNFARLRLGIAHPGHKDKVVDYVLEEFTKEEKKELKDFIEEAAKCCQTWLNDGIQEAMNHYNRRKESKNE
jgi:PTH1 family peptidyl-tRNA hydrolase